MRHTRTAYAARLDQARADARLDAERGGSRWHDRSVAALDGRQRGRYEREYRAEREYAAVERTRQAGIA